MNRTSVAQKAAVYWMERDIHNLYMPNKAYIIESAKFRQELLDIIHKRFPHLSEMSSYKLVGRYIRSMESLVKYDRRGGYKLKVLPRIVLL